MRGLAFILLILFARPAYAGVIATLPDEASRAQKTVALTFDACEAYDKAAFDRGILDYIVSQKLPVTIFMTGRFALHNAGDVKALLDKPFIQIENHSFDHPNWMHQFAAQAVAQQIKRGEDEIKAVTGRLTRFFRFPAGMYNAAGVAEAERLGYRVVHWRWPSGDPDRSMTADRLVARTLTATEAGDVLIFHINQRGWHTAAALPRIVEGLRAKGFRFVTLNEGFGAAHTLSAKPQFSSDPAQ